MMSEQMLQALALAAFVGMTCIGQMLFKKAALTSRGTGDLNQIAHIILNPWLISAIATYASSTILWVFVLQKMPLHQAYPFVALAFVIVPLGDSLLFRQEMSLNYWIGAVLILAGVVITGFSR